MTAMTEPQNVPVLEGNLSQFGPVTVRPLRDVDENILWKRLVKAHHYLGFGKLYGHQLKYFAFLGKIPVAALSFSAPALKLACRDQWIGWTADERRAHLGHIVNNSRFLILPDIRIPNLASCVLGKALSRLPEDWVKHFGLRPWMVESFVDPERFSGTSYRAAGFLSLGKTAGYEKTRTGYARHGKPKEVFLAVLDYDFRTTGGLMNRDPLEPKVTVDFTRWTPDDEVTGGEKLSQAERAVLADQVVHFHKPYEKILAYQSRSRHGQAYLAGLLSNLPRKSAEPIALAFLSGERSVRSFQEFITTSGWEEQRLLDHYRQDVASALVAGTDTDRAMLVVDSSEFKKQGKESVGVARQYCGRLGKVDNCQSGVFVSYAGDKGSRLLSGDLYIPGKWFGEDFRERREKTGLSEDILFRTKPAIAGDLLKAIDDEGLFPARWIGVDATFGMDRNFLQALPPDRWYFASVRGNLHILTQPPVWNVPERTASRGKAPSKPRLTETPRTLTEFASTAEFTPMILKEGSRGPMGAFLHVSRITRVPASPEETASFEWLIIQKTLDGELRFALSNAPEETPIDAFAHTATLRWSIERCFEEAKGHLGMGHYEHRSFRGWHRHMFYVFLAHHFLQTFRCEVKKKLRLLSPWPKDSLPQLFPRGLPPRKRFTYFTPTTSNETKPPHVPTGEEP